jgi:hypothetical protein
MKFSNMLMIYVHTKFNLPRSNGSTITFIKPQLNIEFAMASQLIKKLPRKFKICEDLLPFNISINLLGVYATVASTSEVHMAVILVLLVTVY